MSVDSVSRTSPSGETGFSVDLLGQFKGLESNGHTLNFTRNALGLETERKYQGPETPLLDAFLLAEM